MQPMIADCAALAGSARAKRHRESPRGTFSQAELTAERVIAR
jgi:hypothetical protein